jgi:hypothetical protein
MVLLRPCPILRCECCSNRCRIRAPARRDLAGVDADQAHQPEVVTWTTEMPSSSKRAERWRARADQQDGVELAARRDAAVRRDEGRYSYPYRLGIALVDGTGEQKLDGAAKALPPARAPARARQRKKCLHVHHPLGNEIAVPGAKSQ